MTEQDQTILLSDSVPSPCFVLDEAALKRNLAVMAHVQAQAGVSIILALKGFAMFRVFPIVRETLPGATASSLFEARLAREEFGGQVHAYAPVYADNTWDELAAYCNHITFNSLAQWDHFRDRLPLGVTAGIRVNPEYSPVKTALYNPCTPGSRFGVRAALLRDGLPDGLDGIHCHNLCESDSYALGKTLRQLETLFPTALAQASWLNLGGGHLMTRSGYDLPHLIHTLKDFGSRFPNLRIILEPGSAVAWETGVLVATVLDIVDTGSVAAAMLDTSFATHMPDCLEMPYKPAVRGASEPEPASKPTYRLGGCSCLAGDSVGDYSFDSPLRVGQRLIFEDMMHYTMVKTTMFNGVNLPAIGILHENNRFETIRTFSYTDYRDRLS